MPYSKVEVPNPLIHDHDYWNKAQPLPKTIFSGDINEDYRIISCRLRSSVTMKDFKTCFNVKGTTISDISSQPEGYKKRIILISSKLVNCSLCSKWFTKGKTHTCGKIHPSRALEKCSKCIRYIQKCKMRFHLEKHERNERKMLEQRKVRQEIKEQASLTCRTCNTRCESQNELEVHLSEHPPYICEKCGKGFVKLECLKMHLFTHSDKNSYLCEFCGKGFKYRTFLRSHLHTHTTFKFKCQFCSRLFKQQMHVKSHMRNTHFKTYNSQCVYCGKQFIDTTKCNYHIRLVHLKIKPFECNICHKKFGRADNLRVHKLSHTGESRLSTTMRYKIQDNGKPVHCKFCKKLCKNITNLRRHLETHVKRYTCQFCPLTFSRKLLCQKHESYHKGGTVNFFRCNTCWKKFSTKEALKEHASIHDKPQYSCDLCKKTFNRKFLINNHKLVDHMNMNDERDPDKIIVDSLLEVSENPDAILFL